MTNKPVENRRGYGLKYDSTNREYMARRAEERMEDDEPQGVRFENDGVPDKSAVEVALYQVSEIAESLHANIARLDERLALVTNQYPNPTSPEGMKDDSNKPDGASPLVQQINVLNDDLQRQNRRVQRILEKLDV